MPTWRCENRCPTNDPLPPTRVFTASILFVQGASAYIEYVLKYFSDKEANVMLKDVIVHIKAGVDGGLDDQIYEGRVRLPPPPGVVVNGEASGDDESAQLGPDGQEPVAFFVDFGRFTSKR